MLIIKDIPPFKKTATEMMKNGAIFPTKSYMRLPNGYPTRTPRAMLPRTMPIILLRITSSGNCSATRHIPVHKINSYQVMCKLGKPNVILVTETHTLHHHNVRTFLYPYKYEIFMDKQECKAVSLYFCVLILKYLI